MTPTTKPVTRVTVGTYHNSQRRALVCTLGPGDVLYMRPKGTRREEGIDLISCYEAAIKRRVLRERFEKAKGKGGKSRQR